MFSRLNAEGRTIILITHEEDIAAFAKRIDPPARRPDHRRSPARPGRRALAAAGSTAACDGRGRGSAGVNVLDTLRIAWQGASANKLRSALTVLGVLIGVAAVIILLAVGTGSSQAVQNRIKPARHEHDHRAQPGPVRPRPLDDRDAVAERRATEQSVQAIEDPNQAPDVQSVSPVVSTTETATYQGGELLDLGDRHDPGLPHRRGLHARGRQPDHERRTSPTAGASSCRADRAQQPLLDRREPARPDDPARLGELPDRRRARREGHLGDDEPGQRRDRPLHRRPGRADRRVGLVQRAPRRGQVDQGRSTTPRPRSRTSSPPRTTRPSPTSRSR